MIWVLSTVHEVNEHEQRTALRGKSAVLARAQADGSEGTYLNEAPLRERWRPVVLWFTVVISLPVASFQSS